MDQIKPFGGLILACGSICLTPMLSYLLKRNPQKEIHSRLNAVAERIQIHQCSHLDAFLE